MDYLFIGGDADGQRISVSGQPMHAQHLVYEPIPDAPFFDGRSYGKAERQVYRLLRFQSGDPRDSNIEAVCYVYSELSDLQVMELLLRHYAPKVSPKPSKPPR